MIKLIAIFLICTACHAEEVTWYPSPAGEHHKSIVTVISRIGRGQQTGAGCYVEFHYMKGVLTAKHAAYGRVIVKWSDGTETVPTTIKYDKFGYDLAFLKTKHDTINPLYMSRKAPTEWKQLEFCGFGGPVGSPLRHWFAYYSGVKSELLVRYSAGTIEGDSGGPILNSRHQIVGVITHGDGQPVSKKGYAKVYRGTRGPPYSAVKDFLSRAKAKLLEEELR